MMSMYPRQVRQEGQKEEDMRGKNCYWVVDGFGRDNGGKGTSSLRAGKNTLKVLPFPGSGFTAMQPQWALTIPRTTARPRPRPVNLSEKNGSKITPTDSSSIPPPS